VAGLADVAGGIAAVEELAEVATASVVRDEEATVL
jgi:hypothetical protein